MWGFQFCQAILGEGVYYPTNTAQDPTDLDEKVLLTDKCLIPGFQFIVIHGRTQNTMMMGHRLNVMTQAPYPNDKADLSNGLYIMRTYTELKKWQLECHSGAMELDRLTHAHSQGLSHWLHWGSQCCSWCTMLSQTVVKTRQGGPRDTSTRQTDNSTEAGTPPGSLEEGRWTGSF